MCVLPLFVRRTAGQISAPDRARVACTQRSVAKSRGLPEVLGVIAWHCRYTVLMRGKSGKTGLTGILAVAIAAVPFHSGADPTIETGYNSYGYPGLIEMPVATSRPDGELAFTTSSFAGQTRNTLTFQITPRLSGSFRYSILENDILRAGRLQTN